MTLVDSNVLLDVFTRTPNWWEWSLAQLEEAALEGTLLINDVIYAETSIRFHSMDEFDAALARFRHHGCADAARRHFSSRARPSSSTGTRAEFATACSRTFSLAPTRKSTAAVADARSAAVSKLFSERHADCTGGTKLGDVDQHKERGPSLRWSPSTVGALPGMCPNRSSGRDAGTPRRGRTTYCKRARRGR